MLLETAKDETEVAKGSLSDGGLLNCLETMHMSAKYR